MVSKAPRGRAWSRGLTLNLGHDFQRALISKKIVLFLLYMVSNGPRGGAWFRGLRLNKWGATFKELLYQTKSFEILYMVAKDPCGGSWFRDLRPDLAPRCPVGDLGLVTAVFTA